MSAAAPAKKPRNRRWTALEVQALALELGRVGEQKGKWKAISDGVSQAGGGRSSHDCLLRWTQVDDPKIKKGAWSEDETERLHAAVEQLGKNWVAVAKSVGSGRTPHSCQRRLKSKPVQGERMGGGAHAQLLAARAGGSGLAPPGQEYGAPASGGGAPMPAVTASGLAHFQVAAAPAPAGHNWGQPVAGAPGAAPITLEAARAQLAPRVPGSAHAMQLPIGMRSMIPPIRPSPFDAQPGPSPGPMDDGGAADMVSMLLGAAERMPAAASTLGGMQQHGCSGSLGASSSSSDLSPSDLGSPTGPGGHGSAFAQQRGAVKRVRTAAVAVASAPAAPPGLRGALASEAATATALIPAFNEDKHRPRPIGGPSSSGAEELGFGSDHDDDEEPHLANDPVAPGAGGLAEATTRSQSPMELLGMVATQAGGHEDGGVRPSVGGAAAAAALEAAGDNDEEPHLMNDPNAAISYGKAASSGRQPHYLAGGGRCSPDPYSEAESAALESASLRGGVVVTTAWPMASSPAAAASGY